MEIQHNFESFTTATSKQTSPTITTLKNDKSAKQSSESTVWNLHYFIIINVKNTQKSINNK